MNVEAAREIAARYEAWLEGVASPDPVTADMRSNLWCDFLHDVPDYILDPQWGSARTPFGVTYFASGTNDEGTIEGLSDAGYHVGVAVHALPAAGPAHSKVMRRLTRRGSMCVFVDSGAFGEFTASLRGRREPITDAEWDRRLKIYERLAADLGPRAYLVAPDKVADQRGTFTRLARYAGRVRKMAAAGANIIVPVQKGRQTMPAFWSDLKGTLGRGNWIAGIPLKADATTLLEAVRFIGDAKVKRAHLLGMGPEASGGVFCPLVEAMRAASPGIQLTADSVLLRRLVGRSNGPAGGPRAITKRRQELAKLGWDRFVAGMAAFTVGLDLQGVRHADP